MTLRTFRHRQTAETSTRKTRRRALLGLLALAAAGTVALVVALPSGVAQPRGALSVARTASTLDDLCWYGTVTGPGARTFELETKTGDVITPDGNTVLMWSYAREAGAFQVPSPVLCANEDDDITIELTNNLGEATSIVLPGQSGVSASGLGPAGLLTKEASAGGGTVIYTFEASEPGTYLYESGTDPQKQIQMGLYGALIVRPTMGADFAYNHASTQFNAEREFLVILHELDPDLHRAVELGQPYDATKRTFAYWHVNGRSFPDSISGNGVPWLPNQPYGALVRVEPYDAGTNPKPALIRYLNAGLENHPFHPHGNHLRVIARDGRLLRGPTDEDASSENFARTIGSGQTSDLTFRWDDVDAWIAAGPPSEPVTIPNLQNLVFKDDVTFYSGDPELGETGELPVGVTSFNECGEFYFPWHSHALNEFTNFDEGFGGMATLLRVDPPGGCP